MASLAALARRQPRAAARNAPSLGAQPGASKPEQGGTAGAAGVARTAAEVLKQMEMQLGPAEAEKLLGTSSSRFSDGFAPGGDNLYGDGRAFPSRTNAAARKRNIAKLKQAEGPWVASWRWQPPC